MTTIDLTVLTQNKVRMLTGHQRGVASRDHFNLDFLEQAEEQIVVIAPDNLETITPSFVQGLFAATVKRFGGDAPAKRYDFSRLPTTLQEDMIMGIERLKFHSSAKT